MFTESEKEEYKKIYSEYAKNRDDMKDMNGAINDLVKNFAKKFEIKASILKKTLDFKYKLHQTGEDVLAEITQVTMEAELEN